MYYKLIYCDLYEIKKTFIIKLSIINGINMNVIKAQLINFHELLNNEKENIHQELIDNIKTKLSVIISKIKNNDATISIQKDIVKLLSEISNDLGKYPQKKPIQKLNQQILQIQTLVKQTPLALPPKVEKPKIDVHMGFVCNLDIPDHNGAMAQRAMLFLNQNSPFMTTRSMLKGTGITDFGKGDKKDSMMVLAKYLFDNQKRWEIYELKDDSEGNDLLFFVPASLFPDKTEKEKLEAMDLRSDGSLKRISAEEAYQIPKGKVSVETAFKFFSDTPKHTKLFLLAGHGSNQKVAGLNKESYLKWLNFLKDQKCQGATIHSCFSGGESSLISMTKGLEGKEKDKKKVEELSSSLPFPMVVRSIGDFPTMSGQKAEHNIDLYFKELALFLESSLDSTAANFRKTVEKVEGDVSKHSSNRIKVYFPHRGDSPGGYRSLGEHGLGYPLTYTKLRGIELQHKLLNNKSELNAVKVEVSDAPYLDIHPLIVDIPIRFKGKDPMLLSMIPGKGQHFLKAIELAASTPEVFLQENMKYYQNFGIGVPKAFFIGALKSNDISFEEVALHISPERCYCLYKHQGQYYYMDGQTTMPITPMQNAILLKMAENSTLPSAAAARASSGGQESHREVSDILKTDDFGSLRENKPRSYLATEAWVKQPEELMKFADSKDLTDEDRLHLCFLLLDYERGDIALEVFKQYQLKPDQNNLIKSPLLGYAIHKGQMAFAEYLIEHKADVNAQDLNGDTPLHHAIAAGNRKGVELLLKQPNIRLEIENKRGVTPLFNTWPKYPELFHLLKEKGASVNYVNRGGESLLSRGVFAKEAGVDKLLAEKADPNLGKPSAFTEAVRKNDLFLVKKMMEQGGKPFQPDGKGCVPFIEAILHGSAELVDLLLAHVDLNVDIQDGKGLVPLAAALFEGDPRKIQSLINKGFDFSSILSFNSLKFINNFVERSAKLGKIDNLKMLLKLNLPEDGNIHASIILNLLNNDIDMLTTLVKDDNILPEMIIKNLWMGRKNPTETPLQRRQLLSMCIDKGLTAEKALDLDVESEWLINHLIELGKLDSINLQEQAISCALRSNKPELLDLLLEKGYKVSQETFFKGEFIKTGYNIGKLPLMEKILQMGKKWGVEIKNMNTEEIKALWADVVRSEDKNAVVRLISEGISPKVKQENYLLKSLNKANRDFLVSLIEGKIIQSQQLSNLEIELIINAVVKRSPPEVIKKVVQQLSLDLNILLEEQRCTLFQRILSRGDKDLIVWCLEQGADLNKPNQDGLLPIFGMLSKGNRDVVELLFQKGAKLATLEVQQEAFSYALKSGKPEMIDILLSKGSKLSEDFFKDRQFLLVSTLGGIPMMEKILQLAKQFKFDLTSLEDEEKKQLWKKGLSEDPEEAKKQTILLLKNGVSPMASGNHMIEKWLKYNPLNLEVASEWFIRQLVELGKLDSINLQEQAICYALKSNKPELLELLLEKGYKVAQETFFKEELIATGYDIGKLPLMEKILQMGKKWGVDIKGMTNQEKKALWADVVTNEDKDAIARLISEEISPIVKQKNYLLKSLSEANPDFLVSLIEGKIIQSSQLSNPEIEFIINAIVIKESPEVIKKVVLGLSLDLNTLFEEGRCTLFQRILSREDKDLIEWCLEQGADINKPNQDGLLAIFGMLSNGNREVVELLFRKGAKLATLEVQQEAFFYALKSGKPEMIDILISKGSKISEDFFKGRQFILESTQGGMPMMEKILQVAKQFQIDLTSLEDEEKKQLWKKVLNQKTEDAKKQALWLLKNGVSPLVSGKNMLEKWIKNNPNEEIEEKLKPLIAKFEE